MTQANPIERKRLVTRHLEVRVGNLTHLLLSISDYTKSAQIAADSSPLSGPLVNVRGDLY
jgi:hypothetical protein